MPNSSWQSPSTPDAASSIGVSVNGRATPLGRAVEHQAQLDTRGVGDDLGGLVGLVLRGDEDLRLAVVDDVLEFTTLQARRRAGVDGPRVVAPPHDLEVPIVVLHADGH